MDREMYHILICKYLFAFAMFYKRSGNLIQLSNISLNWRSFATTIKYIEHVILLTANFFLEKFKYFVFEIKKMYITI